MCCLSAYGFHFVCDNGEEECVKERREERYCWRAGVMSRNEGEEKEELFVWTVFLL